MKTLLRMFVFVALAIPATVLALPLGHPPQATSATINGMPEATSFAGVPEIGALYATAHATRHECTASVVHSAGRNTLITAAHCVVGSGAGMAFAPGLAGTVMPSGRWIVTAAYLESKWVTRRDPHADVAFLTVAPRTINGVVEEVEDVTGGYRLGPTATRGQRVTITGYPAGSNNDPIVCVAMVYVTETFPSFDCRGFVGGTSGSPWLQSTRSGTEIVGVIGGLNQGGCYDYTSYSSPLARDADDPYLRAAEDGPADVAPQPGGDGC
jgi:V8-like Glu-specific endopeptidase